MKAKINITAIILLLIGQPGFTQNSDIKFTLVEGPNGKSLGKVTAMAQDPYGYMWFCAQGEEDKCLYRYDGNRMISFKNDHSNPNSLGGTSLETIYADDSGMIWIGFGDVGLDQFNPVTGVFKHYRHTPNDPGSLSSNSVAAIFKDHRNRLWVGTDKGLDRLDDKTGKFFHYQNEPGNAGSLSCNSVRAIYEDRRGTIWVGTGFPFAAIKPDTTGGLNRLNPDGTFTRYLHDSKNPHSLINNKVRSIFEDSRGIFWIGTSDDGLHTMDREKEVFVRHLYNPAKPDQLSRPPLKPEPWKKYNDQITFICEDSTGGIWIGTMLAGINRYDTGTKKITHYESGNGFPDNSGWAGFTSRDGVLWVATEEAHLYQVNPFHKSLYSIPTADRVNNFLEDKEGYLWVCTGGSGLLIYDQQKKLIKQFKHDPSDSSSLLDNNVGPLFPYGEGTIWVGSFDGIRVLNKFTQKFSRIPDRGNLRDANDSGFVKIYKDKKGSIWFVRWGLGLINYNPKDNLYKHFLPDTNDSASITSNRLNSILEDRSGQLWIGGVGGINRLNRETGRFKHFLAGTFITCFYEDSGGTVWAGSAKGLFRYIPKDDQFSGFFDPQTEISSFTVGGIIEDNAKNLWLTSPSAIIKLNPVTKETFIYGNRFGIIPNSLAPWTSSYKTEKGQLLMGHENGFYVFYPEELAVDKDLKILITDLFINTLPVLPGKGSPLPKPVEEISDLDLKYNQNNIAFNFAAIDFREPQATKYMAMLENYDNTWREAKGEKSSYYFNIPPGKYVYRVKAINSDGTLGEKLITIHINPPWWKTWWAYVIYGLLLVAAIFAVYRVQKQRIISKERQKTQMKELAQAKEIEKAYTELKSTQALLIQSEKMASLGELTAGIAHEIQNPLNFVNNFSEINNELIDEMNVEIDKGNMEEVKAIAIGIKKNLDKVNHHGKRADAIVKGMLQHSRTSTGIKEKTDINKLTDEYLRLAYHGLRAKDKAFNATMKTDFDEKIGDINIIPQDIGRVLLNLYNNAFHATTEKKKLLGEKFEPVVTVGTSLNLLSGGRGQAVFISVKDNGPGIPQKILDKIFQPFFTTKPTGQGTGLGLSLSYDIIKAHGGEIKVTTEENKGSEFTIILPL